MNDKSFVYNDHSLKYIWSRRETMTAGYFTWAFCVINPILFSHFMIHIAEKNALKLLLCLFMHKIGFLESGSNAWVELCDRSFFRFRFIACHKYYCALYISNQMKNPCLDDTSTLVGWLTANQVSIYILYVHHIREKAIIFARKTSILTRDLVNGKGNGEQGSTESQQMSVFESHRARLRFPRMKALAPRGHWTVVRSERTYSKPSRVFF